MGPENLIEETGSEFQIKPGGVVASPTESWELVQSDAGAEGELDALSVCSSDDEGEAEEEGAKPTEKEPAPRRRRAAFGAFGAAVLLVAAVACSRPLAVRAVGAGASSAPAPAPAQPVSCLEEALLSAAKYVEDVAPALSEAAVGLTTAYNLTKVEETVKGSVADAAAFAAGLANTHRGTPAAVAGAAAAFLKKQNATELGRAAAGTLETTKTFLAAQNYTRLSKDARSLFGFAADAVMESAEAAAGALAASNLTGTLAEALRDPETLPKVIAASALGVTGFAVGVPFIPGITDNLLLGAAGAVFPFLYGNATK